MSAMARARLLGVEGTGNATGGAIAEDTEGAGWRVVRADFAAGWPLGDAGDCCFRFMVVVAEIREMLKLRG